VGEGWGHWLFSWNLVGQVQHVAKRPADRSVPGLRAKGTA
jgi:hypothetical protein